MIKMMSQLKALQSEMEALDAQIMKAEPEANKR